MGSYLIKTTKIQETRLFLDMACAFQRKTNEDQAIGLRPLPYLEARKKLLRFRLQDQWKRRSKAFIYMEQKNAEQAEAEQISELRSKIRASRLTRQKTRKTSKRASKA